MENEQVGECVTLAEARRIALQVLKNAERGRIEVAEREARQQGPTCWDMPPQEKPMIFSAAMVRAILLRLKCQTRRVMKEQPPDDDFDVGFYHPTMIDRKGEEYPGDEVFGAYSKDGEWGIKSQFAPGMTLWVRETWRTYERIVSNNRGIKYRADGSRLPIANARDDTSDWAQAHREDDKWRPSIFMPRWASRLTLKVTEVRIEQVQSISEDDAIAEGVECEFYDGTNPISGCWWDYDRKMWSGAFPNGEEARGSFRTLWDSINIKRNGGKYSWETNPYCWIILFKRLTK